MKNEAVWGVYAFLSSYGHKHRRLLPDFLHMWLAGLYGGLTRNQLAFKIEVVRTFDRGIGLLSLKKLQ